MAEFFYVAYSYTPYVLLSCTLHDFVLSNRQMGTIQLGAMIRPLVENGPIVPVHLGHRSRLPNRDPLLGTNAGPGSSTNRDREVSTWTS
jgi:hypothetical protein